MSVRTVERPYFEQKYPTGFDPDQIVNATALCGVHQRAEQWGIDYNELVKMIHVLLRFNVELKDKSACYVFCRAESLSKLKNIEDLQAQIRIQTSSPIPGKIAKAQLKLTELESAVGLREEALAKAKKEQAAAALLHREACALKAIPNKSSQAKRKVNANWHQINANKSRTEDLLRRAEAALEAAKKELSDQLFRISLLNEELARTPSFDLSNIEGRIQRITNEIEASTLSEQQINREMVDLKIESYRLIESFIQEHVSTSDAHLQGDVREKLKKLVELS